MARKTDRKKDRQTERKKKERERRQPRQSRQADADRQKRNMHTVKLPPQAPDPGHAAHSVLCSSSAEDTELVIANA